MALVPGVALEAAVAAEAVAAEAAVEDNYFKFIIKLF